MNGINNNISNSNYKAFENGSSNSSKDEKSIFDNIVDSVKDFFDSDSVDSKYSSYNVKSNANLSLERAFLASKSNIKNTYTLAPQKNQLTTAEKWAKENENAQIKQKEKEIANLKQKVDVLQSRNKVLLRENEQISEQVKTQNITKTVNNLEQAHESQNRQNNGSFIEKEKVKTHRPIPTHTSIPKKILEQQKNEINEIASNDLASQDELETKV